MKPLFGLILAAFAAPALAGRVKAITPPDMDGIVYLEEVVVQGDRTLAAARVAIKDAEDRFYRRWNELNTDPQYDVFCSRYARTGTLLVVPRCEGAFVQEAEARAAREVFGDLTGVVFLVRDVVPWLAPYLEEHQVELKRRALEMAAKDTELKRALFERARLARHYAELRKEKFKDHWIAR